MGKEDLGADFDFAETQTNLKILRTLFSNAEKRMHGGVPFLCLFLPLVAESRKLDNYWVITSPSLNKEYCIVLYCTEK